MADRIKNETDEAITIDPGETIKVKTYKERERALASRPTTHKIQKVFKDWE